MHLFRFSARRYLTRAATDCFTTDLQPHDQRAVPADCITTLLPHLRRPRAVCAEMTVQSVT